jgi:3-oxoadipate enol-lactonase
VVVLAPSLGTTLGVWAHQAARLAEDFRVLRCDLRGHGRSPAPEGPYSIAELGGDLLALLDRVGVERASLCGISIGAMAGMWVAAHAPERVSRLVLCCTSARVESPERYRERAATVRREGLEAVADGVVERWFTPSFRAREPAVVERMRGQLVQTPAEGYAGCCEAIAGMDLREDLDAIAAPTLAIAGAEDLATPPDHARAIAAAIPDARFELVPDAAHLANLEQPARVAELIAGHLKPVEEERT